MIEDAAVGLNDKFKVGHWAPLWISLSANGPTSPLRLRVQALDGDGIRTRFTQSDKEFALGETPQTFLRYVKTGRIQSAVVIEVLDQHDQIIAQKSMVPPLRFGTCL